MLLDLSGQRFGNIVILGYSCNPFDGRGVRYVFRCDCGREGKISHWQIKHDKDKSACRYCRNLLPKRDE